MEEEKPKSDIKSKLITFYDKEYKKLLIIPFVLLALSLAFLVYQYATTGDFINRDVSLKGGMTLTIHMEEEVDLLALKNYLSSEFPTNDISARSVNQAGKQVGIVINSDMDGSKKAEVDALIGSVSTKLNRKLEKDEYSVEFVGSSLGASFFREILTSIFIAFLFMGTVVFLYFGTNTKQKVFSIILAIVAAILVFGVKTNFAIIIAYIIGAVLLFIYIRYSAPSLAVILSVFSDIIITLAIVNLLGVRIGTAGIASFLMLIGYSVDTDILLCSRVLKVKGGLVMDKIFSAMKTGLMMVGATTIAVVVALILTQSEVIKQIMTILLVGLLVDVIATWIQNVGLIRLYLDKKERETNRS